MGGPEESSLTFIYCGSIMFDHEIGTHVFTFPSVVREHLTRPFCMEAYGAVFFFVLSMNTFVQGILAIHFPSQD